MMFLVTLAVAADLLGPLPDGTALLGVDTHAEYVRWHLRTDRPFVVEVTAARPGGTPVCSAGGRDLWVRADLAVPGESFVWDPLPAVVFQACERLAEHGPDVSGAVARDGAPLESRTPPSEEGTPDASAGGSAGVPAAEGPRWGGASVLAIAWIAGAVLFVARGGFGSVGILAAALGVRLVWSPRTVFLGGDAAYERLESATVRVGHDSRYGDGFAALYQPLVGVLGPRWDAVHLVTIGLSALAVPLAALVSRRLTGRGGPAWVTAALLLALPIGVATSAMEDAWWLVTALHLSGVLGALGAGPKADGRRSSGVLNGALPWFGALAAGGLAHVRPDQIPFTLVPLALLLRRREWGPVVLLGVLVGLRAGELVASGPAELSAASRAVQYSLYLDPSFWFDSAIPGGTRAWLLLQPALCPLGVVVLAIFGVMRRPRWGALPVVAALAGAILLLPKASPLGDLIRFQLPIVVWAAIPAGWALLGTRGFRRAVLVLGSAASFVVAASPLDGGWAWQHEYAWLIEQLPARSANERIRVLEEGDPHGAMRRWMASRGPAQVIGDAEPLRPTDIVFRGVADAAAATFHTVGPSLEPIVVADIPAATDGWIDLGVGTIPIGFYRVAPPPASPSDRVRGPP